MSVFVSRCGSHSVAPAFRQNEVTLTAPGGIRAAIVSYFPVKK